jgi:hypothetical protein
LADARREPRASVVGQHGSRPADATADPPLMLRELRHAEIGQSGGR